MENMLSLLVLRMRNSPVVGPRHCGGSFGLVARLRLVYMLKLELLGASLGKSCSHKV